MIGLTYTTPLGCINDIMLKLIDDIEIIMTKKINISNNDLYMLKYRNIISMLLHRIPKVFHLKIMIFVMNIVEI